MSTQDQPVYNKIGNNYNRTRTADMRIVTEIKKHLNGIGEKYIADIGAGTGNYSLPLALDGYKVWALEPSDTMLEQCVEHPNITWNKGVAENILAENESFHAAVSILASHHFKNLNQAFSEISRILKPGGTFVLFTADPRLICSSCWLRQYFSKYIAAADDTLPDIKNMIALAEKWFGSKPSIHHFHLPPDLNDGFFYSAWQKPEKYLDPVFRNGISVFSALPEAVMHEAIGNLQNDLDSGAWDKKYGQVRDLKEYNGGYYFLNVTKAKK